MNWPEDCVAIVFAAALALPILFVDVHGRGWSLIFLVLFYKQTTNPGSASVRCGACQSHCNHCC